MPNGRTTDITEKRRSYHPEDTATVRKNTINQIVTLQGEFLRAPSRTDLHDLAAVQTVTNECMQKCAEAGVLPNMEALAACLGIGRQTLYDFIHANRDSQTVQYLNRVRTAWAAARQMAADRGVVDATHSIFVLLNSSLGFTNEHRIELSQRNALLDCDPGDAEAARRKYLPDYDAAIVHDANAPEYP